LSRNHLLRALTRSGISARARVLPRVWVARGGGPRLLGGRCVSGTTANPGGGLCLWSKKEANRSMFAGSMRWPRHIGFVLKGIHRPPLRTETRCKRRTYVPARTGRNSPPRARYRRPSPKLQSRKGRLTLAITHQGWPAGRGPAPQKKKNLETD